MPGMFCEVYWPTQRKHSSCFVPSSAVNTTSTLETFVSRVNPNDEIEWVKVKRGQLMGQMVEIFGDIKEGDLVALKADDELAVDRARSDAIAVPFFRMKERVDLFRESRVRKTDDLRVFDRDDAIAG